MPPKKIVEKARVKPPQVKEPKGVRKRQNAPIVPPKRRRKTSLNANTCNYADSPSEPPKTKPKAAPKRKKHEQILIEDAGTLPPLNMSLNKTKSPQMTSKNETEPTIEDFNNCLLPVSSSRSKGKSKQKMDIPEIKIMLANDVVRTAFQKKPIINIDLAYPPLCEDTKVKPKRGRPKQTSVKLLDYVTNVNSVPANSRGNDETIQAVAKKKLVKCGPKKRPANTDDTFVDGEPQSGTIANDLTGDIETPKKKKKLSLKRKKDTDPPTETKDTRVLRKKGKDDCGTSTNIITASESALNCVPETNGNVQSDENKVGGRKFSITSTSTSFSWTKDISSSSANSFVTVQPHDFVRIDKKLPIIKLTNIDHITLKDKNDNIFDDENSLDNREDRASECSTYVSSLNLNVSQTLNLSTSSLTSVTTNRTQNVATGKVIINKNNVVSKLRQSLDNISLKMKSFDLEMIDWIGYNNEIKDETTVEYHKRVFDLLKEENEIIKYCREIKKVLTGVDPQNTEKETNKIEERTPMGLTPEPYITDEIPTELDALNEVDKSTRLIGFKSQIDHNDHTDINKDNNITEMPKSNHTTVNGADGKIPVQTNTSATSQALDPEDDDAISLFAESITCLETSKRNSSYARRSFDAVYTEENNASTERYPRERNPSKDKLDDFDDRDYSGDEEPPNLSPSNGIRENRKIDLSGLRNINDERNILDTPLNNDKDTSNIFNKLNFTNNTHKAIESASNKTTLHDDTMPFKIPVSFAKKFGDFQNIQIKVPLRADVSPNRQYELVGKSKSPETTTKINVTKKPVGPQETNSCNRINNTVNIERSTTLGADNTSFLSANEQSQSPNSTPKQTPQFKGTKIFTCCIFNLFRSQCRKPNCPYPHVTLEEESVSSKLMELNEAEFDKECSYVLSWPVLMIKYGMCFVKECIRRKLTRLLLRFNVGFVSSIHNPTPVIEVVETTLLYLNDVELEPFRDILQWRVGSVTLLCDYYMKVISDTQNFSRFKSVFIKLTLFICAVGGTFSLSVATQLLERVCILGYEDVLAAALIRIIKNAVPEIFSVSMMASFERRLCSNNPQLYEELVGLKVQLGLQSVGVQSLGVGEVLSPCRTQIVNSAPTVTRTSTPIAHASPDACIDSTSNSSEPVITRTIGFNHNIKMAALNMTSGSDTSEEPVKNTFEPRIMQQRWRNHPPGFFPLRQQRKMFQRRFPPSVYNKHPKFRRPPPSSGC